MELKLEDGKYVRGKFQGFAQVSGLEELLQRVVMKLKTGRGTFFPLPNYGSRLHTLPKILPSQRKTAAKQFVLEALSDEQGLELLGLELLPQGFGELGISLEFRYQGGDVFKVETEI